MNRCIYQDRTRLNYDANSHASLLKLELLFVMIIRQLWLTNYSQTNRMTNGWSRGYLALVDTRILSLRISYSENPFFCMEYVHRLETLITRVSISADCQQVNVTMSHPWNLRQISNIDLYCIINIQRNYF